MTLKHPVPWFGVDSLPRWNEITLVILKNPILKFFTCPMKEKASGWIMYDPCSKWVILLGKLREHATFVRKF